MCITHSHFWRVGHEFHNTVKLLSQSIETMFMVPGSPNRVPDGYSDMPRMLLQQMCLSPRCRSAALTLLACERAQARSARMANAVLGRLGRWLLLAALLWAAGVVLGLTWRLAGRVALVVVCVVVLKECQEL